MTNLVAADSAVTLLTATPRGAFKHEVDCLERARRDTPPVAAQSIHVVDVVTPDEAFNAVEAWFDGEIDRDEFFAVISRYLEESEETP